MDLEAQFCERCGRDSSEFASAHLAFHDCPSCGVTCCSDCWNLVEAACLRCAPFRLPDGPNPGPAALMPGRLVAASPTAETPSASASTVGRRGTTPAPRVRRAPPGPRWAQGSAAAPGEHADAPALAGHAAVGVAPPIATAEPVAGVISVRGASRGRGRAGRVGIAASGAWVVVAALAVAAFGATPTRPRRRSRRPPKSRRAPRLPPVQRRRRPNAPRRRQEAHRHGVSPRGREGLPTGSREQP